MKLNKILALSVFASMSIYPAYSTATTLTNDLEDVLNEAREGEKVSVYLNFAEQLDTTPYKRMFKDRVMTNSQRRDILVPALKEVADRTQAPVIEFLNQNDRKVDNFYPYFLSNMILVENATSDLIYDLLRFEEIETISMYHMPTTPKKVGVNQAVGNKGGNQINSLSVAVSGVNADKLWDLGFDGSGRIVMNIDTGVEGVHNYLQSSWYGNEPGVQWFDAWNDAVGTSQFPEDLAGTTHGTGTMSNMVGHTATDTIGTCPGAWWIGSKHNSGTSGAGIFNAQAGFNWAIQLPASTLDYLDVINNSYGGNTGGCASVTEFQFYENMELIGVATVWSAGNEGPGPQTQGDVAAGAISPVHTFSIGSVDQNQTTISGFSSRGPSGCAAGVIVPPPHNAEYKIKPEVVAQGAQIKAADGSNATGTGTNPGGTSLTQGTSFSGPIVSGTIALLRQINPNVTPEQAKTALLVTATDLGDPGDDNDYGMGRVNVLAAASEIAPYLVQGTLFDNATSNPIPFAEILVNETGQTFETAVDGTFLVRPLFDTVTLTVNAFGYNTTSVTNLPQLQEGIAHDQDIAMNLNATADISGAFTNMQGNGVEGDVIVWGITADGEFEYAVESTDTNGNYSVTLPEEDYVLQFIPNFPYPEAFVDQFTVVGGNNVTYDYEDAPATVLIVGADNSAAVDTIYQEIADNVVENDYFYWDLDEQSLIPTQTELSQLSQPSAVIWFTDGKDGGDVLDVNEEQALVDYLNNGGNLILSGQNVLATEDGGTLMGMLDVSYGGDYSGGSDFVRGEAGGFLSAAGAPLGFLMRAAGANGENLQTSRDKITLGTTATKLASYGPSSNDSVSVSFTNGTNFKAVLVGFDIAAIIATSPSLTSSETVVKSLLQGMGVLTDLEEISNTPVIGNYSLEQNYPNPFNPTTTIRFTLPKTTNVKVSVFNVKGQLVKTLVNGQFDGGNNSVVWDAKDSRGNLVSSGTYFYQIETPDFKQTKKAVFLK